MPILVAAGTALLIIGVTRGRLAYQHYQRAAEALGLPAATALGQPEPTAATVSAMERRLKWPE